MASAFRILLVTAGWVLLAGTIVWPGVAMIARCVTDGVAPDGGFTYSGRQWGLFWRSLWMAGAATVMCHLVALPAIVTVVRSGSLSARPWLVAACVACLTCTPMVHAFGWERLWPYTIPGVTQCLVTWAMWAWPIPALLLGAGWLRTASSPFEAACLETSRARALVYVGGRAMAPHLALSMLIVFLFFFQDYTVPHACWLQVFATELLGWASSSPRAIDTLWPSLLPIMVIVPAVAFILAMGRREKYAVGQTDVHGTRPSGLRDSLPFMVVFTISFVVPIAALVVKLSSWEVFREAHRYYGSDILMTLWAALAAGFVVTVMGLGVQTKRVSWIALIPALIVGLLPGALIGRGVIAGYNYAVMAPLFDYWPAVVLGNAARFGWIGLLAGMVLRRRMERDITDQARIDGAGSGDILWRLQLPIGAPIIIGTIAVVAALSADEVAATTMLRVPGFSPIALVIIEKFHRFEDDMLISLSLVMVVTSLVAAILVAGAVKWRSSLRFLR